MRKILEHCPTCGGDLIITQVSCTQCDTVINAKYQPCPFCKLPPDELRFLEAFVMCRGNIKEMERELGASYWAIRSRLNDLVQLLGYGVDPEAEEKLSIQKRDVLKALERGEITVAEAEETLSRLRIIGPQES